MLREGIAENDGRNKEPGPEPAPEPAPEEGQHSRERAGRHTGPDADRTRARAIDS
jgi:hypothetical protein